MSVFDDVIVINGQGELVYNQWVEWDHFLIPNKPEWLRELLRIFMKIMGHCLNCSVLDGCYFVLRNMPLQPLHENCDCSKKSKDYSKVKNKSNAECDIKKFTDYVFKNTKDSKGKNKIFYDLGFEINDSLYLKNEFCRQSIDGYLKGNYVLKNLDRRGQRLAIPISLSGKSFYSG